MRVQRAATPLPGRIDDPIAVHHEDALGRAVGLGEQPLHHAAVQDGDRPAVPFSFRSVGCRLDGTFGGAKHGEGEAESPGERCEEAWKADRTRDSGRRHRESHRPSTREGRENDARHEREGTTGRQRCACRLEQVSVRDPAWTRRFAAAASQTSVDVRLDRGIVEGKFAFHERAHQDEPSAGRVVLVVQGEVGGTGLQAEAAVYTGIESRHLVRERRARDARTAARRGARCS